MKIIEFEDYVNLGFQPYLFFEHCIEVSGTFCAVHSKLVVIRHPEGRWKVARPTTLNQFQILLDPNQTFFLWSSLNRAMTAFFQENGWLTLEPTDLNFEINVFDWEALLESPHPDIHSEILARYRSRLTII